MDATAPDRPAATTPVLLPQMGLEVSEATVLAVLVRVGDEVVEGQALFEIETEKATTELEAPCAGFVIAIVVAEGDEVPVGSVVAEIAAAADVASAAGGATAAPAVDPQPAPSATRVISADGDTRRVRAAPVARRAAASLGLDLSAITGTGPRGRITLRDVEGAGAAPHPANGAAPAVSPLPGDEPTEPLTKMRRVIARRMTVSQGIPQYRLERDVDATHLLAQKVACAAAVTSGPRPGVNDLLMQAIAATVVEHRGLATQFVDDPEPAIRRHPVIGVGLAVATDRGLVVPVVPAVDELGLADIAAERSRLVDAARAGRLTSAQMTGAAITLSNLGGFGVDRFTAMLNPGESAIVAVGRTTDRVVPRGRAITVVPMLTVTMAFDHRVVDGAVGAAALARLAELLEGAMTWRP